MVLIKQFLGDNYMIEKVQKIFKEKFGQDVSADTRIEDLDLDSLDLLELAFHLEDEFGIEVEDEDMMGLVTINDVLEYALKTKEE
jgi:acyl carrier protein